MEIPNEIRNEMLTAIEISLEGNGIRPTYVLENIMKYLDAIEDYKVVPSDFLDWYETEGVDGT